MPEASAKRWHALVVEDDAPTARAIVAGFELQGFETFHASSLAEARTYLEGARPQIACIDLSLPDGYGLDLVPAFDVAGVRATIIVSGERAHEHVVHGLQGGVYHHFVKPLKLSKLLDAIIEIKSALQGEPEGDAQREGDGEGARLASSVH